MGITPTESCLACRRCDTVAFQFSRIFESFRCPSMYAAGSTIFAEGQRPTGVYVLCQGAVNVTLTSNRGKTAVLRSCLPGDLIGLADVLSSEKLVTRASALTTSEIAHVPAAQFQRAVSGSCDALVAIGQLLASEMRQYWIHTASVYLNPSGRARFLDWLGRIRETGRRTHRGVEIPFPYTQNQLAEYLSCTRETVARLLVNFSHRGAIERHGATLILGPDFDRRLGRLQHGRRGDRKR